MAYEFDGSADGLVLPNLTGVNDFTITLLVRALSDKGSNAAAIAWDNFPTTPREAVLYLADRAGDLSGLYASVDDTGASDYASPNLPLNVDTPILIRRQGTTVELYVAGVLYASATVGSGAATMENGRLGCHYFSGSNGEFANVRVSHLGVHTDYLDAGDIAAHAAGAKPDELTSGAILHHYPLTEDLSDAEGAGADLTTIGSPVLVNATTASSFEGAGVATGWGTRREIARDENGRIWVAYYNTALTQIQAVYSDDEGKTWSAPELVAATNDDPFCLAIASDGDPVVVYNTTSTFFTYRGGAGSPWSAVASSLSVAGIILETGFRIFQDPDGRWHLLMGYESASDSLRHYVNDDDLATGWTLHKTETFANTISGSGFEDRTSVSFDMDLDGNIHMVGCGRSVASSGNFALWYRKYTLATTTWGAAEEIALTGSTSDAFYHSGWNQITVDDDGFPHIVGQVRQTTASQYQYVYSNKRSGSWLALERPYGAELSSFQFGTMGVHSDGTPYCLIDSPSFGAATLTRYYTRSAGGAWTNHGPIHSNDGVVRRIRDCLSSGRLHVEHAESGFLALLVNTGATPDQMEVVNFEAAFGAPITTLPPTTPAPTTPAPTPPPTTTPPTTPPPTTPAPTTLAPTTQGPTTPPVTLPPGPDPGRGGISRVLTSRTVFVGPRPQRPGDLLPPPE